MRVTDANELLALSLQNAASHQNIGPLENVEEWVSDPRNVALRFGDDLGLFEYVALGVFECHAFCLSRGGGAIRSIRAALDTMRTEYGAKSFVGHTQRWNERWLYRHLGFTPVRELVRNGEKYTLIALTGTLATPQQ
jgi:hypothetical protein